MKSLQVVLLRRSGDAPRPFRKENVANSLVGQTIAQIMDRANDSVITPRRILAGESDDEFLKFGFGRRSPVSLPKPGAIELLGHQSAVPFEDRLGFDDGDSVRHQFTESDGSLGEGAALVVGE
jgi:hypothetical protein